jgi:hypothetical protein
MTRETAWISSNNIRNYELYVKERGSDVIPPVLDSHVFSNAVWSANRTRHLGVSPGYLYANPNGGDTSQHFKTRWGTYINPSGANVGNVNVGGGGAINGGNYNNDDADLRPQDLIGKRYRDASGRTLWLNAGKQCTAKRAGGTVVNCKWELRDGGTIVVEMSATSIWYYYAKNAGQICFTGENTPGATCLGVLNQYTP